MDFPRRTTCRTSTRYGWFAIRGADAGGDRTITEPTASTVVRGSTAVRGDGGTVIGDTGSNRNFGRVRAPFLALHGSTDLKLQGIRFLDGRSSPLLKNT